MKSISFTIEETISVDDVKLLLNSNLKQSIASEKHGGYITLDGEIRFTGDVVSYDNQVQTIECSFPVNITIPSNRVPNINEMYLIIRSFECNLDDADIIIDCDIEITGVLEHEIVRL
jgi:hypothetical protein